MKTKSSGFTLIELLVVVAILGILSAVGLVSYNGYVEGTKYRSAQNMLQQISLAQTEYFSETQQYYSNGDCDDVNSATVGTSREVEAGLFEGAQLIVETGRDTPKAGYNFCIQDTGDGEFVVHALGKKKISLNSIGEWTEQSD